MTKDYSFGSYIALWLFGIAFGAVEAAVVVYLRQLIGQQGDSLFPLASTLQQQNLLIMEVELQREAATLVLMLVPAFLFSRTGFVRFVAYMLVFGTWDICYYAFLKLFLGWPAGPLTYDVLFLLPTVWVAPVLCPLLVSLALVLFPSLYLYHARIRLIRGPTLTQWLVAVLGGALVLFAFMKDAGYYLQGGMPPRFSWSIFMVGYLLAVAAGAHFLYQFRRQPKTRFI